MFLNYNILPSIFSLVNLSQQPYITTHKKCKPIFPHALWSCLHSIESQEIFLTVMLLLIAWGDCIEKYCPVITVPPPNRAYLRTLIHSGDLEHLEKVVLDGHGHKLLHETSALEKVTKFIYALPDFMVKYWSCY